MPKFTSKRLRSNALLITVGISLLIAIFCSLFLLLAYNHLRFVTGIEREAKLDRNLRSAINLVLGDSSSPLGRQVQVLDLYGDGTDSVTTWKEVWGLFRAAGVQVHDGEKTKSAVFYLGQSCTVFPLTQCLYLADHQRGLSLSGHTRLVGDAYLPGAGLNKVFVEQLSYPYPDLIRGSVQKSSDSLPAVKPKLIQDLLQWKDDQATGSNSGSLMLSLADRQEQSFADSAVIIHYKGPILLSSCQLTGHIKIISDSIIRVAMNTRLENVILMAPVIEMDSGFSGTVQAMAMDSILIGNNCHFLYPSSLVLLKRATISGQPFIRIGDSCDLDGVILSYSTKLNDLLGTYVQVGKGSRIVGCVYVAGHFYLMGSVYGTVLTDYLVYKSPATYYENYLVDATIDRASLPDHFSVPDLFGIVQTSKLVQWVR